MRFDSSVQFFLCRLSIRSVVYPFRLFNRNIRPFDSIIFIFILFALALIIFFIFSELRWCTTLVYSYYAFLKNILVTDDNNISTFFVIFCSPSLIFVVNSRLFFRTHFFYLLICNTLTCRMHTTIFFGCTAMVHAKLTIPFGMDSFRGFLFFKFRFICSSISILFII